MRLTTLPAIALLLVASGAVMACDGEAPVGLEPTEEVLLARNGGDGPGEEAGLTVEQRQQLAALRAVTARFHDVEAAMEAGWAVPVTPCLSHPTDGAMGYHYGNVALLDDQVAVLEPEALLYEPRKNGKLRLVAVEYLIPFAILPPDADAPELLGQTFHANHGAGVWALHVWIWRNNPSGLFAHWNPNVTCDWAD